MPSVFPEAILLDFGGTLDADGLTWLERFHSIYRSAGIDAPEDAFAQAFYAADDGLAARFPLKGLGLEETIRLQVRCVLERLAPGRLSEAQAIAGRFTTDSREALSRNRGLLESWRGRGAALGIVSNFYGNLDSVLAGEGLLPLFGTVMDSAAAGVLKPDPAIFRLALDELGAAPSRTWMVGDSIERDMRGAERAGLAHAWLRGTRAGPPCCGEARVLGSLADLEASLATPAGAAS